MVIKITVHHPEPYSHIIPERICHVLLELFYIA